MRTALVLLLMAAAPSWQPALVKQGITDARVLAAFEKVRRADYLPEAEKARESWRTGRCPSATSRPPANPR